MRFNSACSYLLRSLEASTTTVTTGVNIEQKNQRPLVDKWDRVEQFAVIIYFILLQLFLFRCQLVYRVPVFCSVFYTPDPDPDHLAERRTSPTTIQLYQPYLSAILGYNYVFQAPFQLDTTRAELCRLPFRSITDLYNPREYPHLLYLALQSNTIIYPYIYPQSCNQHLYSNRSFRSRFRRILYPILFLLCNQHFHSLQSRQESNTYIGVSWFEG